MTFLSLSVHKPQLMHSKMPLSMILHKTQRELRIRALGRGYLPHYVETRAPNTNTNDLGFQPRIHPFGHRPHGMFQPIRAKPGCLLRPGNDTRDDGGK